MQREFGFVLEGRAIVVDDLRVRATGRGVELPTAPVEAPPSGSLPAPAAQELVYFEQGGRQLTPAFLLGTLLPGHQVPGPAILIDAISTVVVEPGAVAHITPAGDVRIELGEQQAQRGGSTACDPIQLAIFSHRQAWQRGHA